MKTTITITFAMLALLLVGPAGSTAGGNTCADNDAICAEFATLTGTGRFERIIERAETAKGLSEAAKAHVGNAYMMLAGKEGATPEQEERFCRKALEYGSSSAYLCLYFIYSGQNKEAALGYLKEYVATKPADPVPYILLGESELEKKNYQAANTYLRDAKKVARGHSSYLDWMLFKVSYILGDYSFACAVLDGALADGLYMKEFRNLVSDPLFEGMVKKPEFRKYEPLVMGTTALARN